MFTETRRQMTGQGKDQGVSVDGETGSVPSEKRRAYVAPVLARLGTVLDLTQGTVGALPEEVTVVGPGFASR